MKTPILHAINVQDFGAFDLSMALSVARSHTTADAYDDPDGEWVFIAHRKPTKADIKQWKQELFEE